METPASFLLLPLKIPQRIISPKDIQSHNVYQPTFSGLLMSGNLKDLNIPSCYYTEPRP